MKNFPVNNSELNPEKITEEKLLSLAIEKPLRDPDVEKLLIQWLEETRIPENIDSRSVDRISVTITHSAMKYRLGFLSKEEVFQELEQAGGCLASEYVDTKELHNKLSQLMYDIEYGVFGVIEHK